MQEIKLCRLEKWIEGNDACVIVGAPSSRLLELENAGYCVLAELARLQGLPEEEVAEALCREEAVQQFEHVCINASELPQGYLRRIRCQSLGQPVVISETSRLLIRESVAEDAEAFVQLYWDEACRRYLEIPPVELETAGGEEQLREAYRRYIVDYQKGQYAFYEYGMWTLVEKGSGEVVGRAGLEQQELVSTKEDFGRKEQETAYNVGETVLGLGYAILPKYRGRGYAVEACLAILEYCRECEYADRVYAKVDARNTASRKVLVKLQKRTCMPLNLILK